MIRSVIVPFYLCAAVDGIRVEGTLSKRSRSSWTQLRPQLMNNFFTSYEQCHISKLQARSDSECDETMVYNKRDELLLAHKCFGHADGSQATSNCHSFTNVEQQVLRWDGAQGGLDSKPSTFLDVLQRLPSGINTVLLMGDSTMQQVYDESVCSLVRHLPEDLLDNLTNYKGVDGPSMEVNAIGIAASIGKNSFWATRVPILGRDVLVLFKRYDVVDNGQAPAIKNQEETHNQNAQKRGAFSVWADEGEESTFKMSEAEGEVELIRSMFETIWRLRGGVLTVATQGFHVFERFEESLPPILDVLQFSGQRDRSRTLFLEPWATHFPHVGGLYADMDPQMRDFSIGPNGCRFDVSTDAAFVNYYGSILNRVLATRRFPNVTLLPFWKETSTRGAVHRGSGESKLDCLHNCPNALLYEPIWEGMLKSIS